MGASSADAFRVTYLLTFPPGEDPAAKASALALEQTVELPEGAFPAALGERIAGRVEEVQRLGAGTARALLAYPCGLLDGGFPQLLNLLFGNVSMQRGVRVEDVDWPSAVLDRAPGPALGIEGVRQLCGAEDRRPLLCAALKPVGLAAPELAELARGFARAGVDLIKDDHSLADQGSAPAAERLARCHEAVEEANRETGGRALYAPHLTGGPGELAERAEAVRRAGCRAALVAPLPLGLAAVAWLARGSGLALLGHPSLSGAFFQPNHGIAPEVLLGDLFRLAGCDGVIYPNSGGRFFWSLATCEAINHRLRRPLGAVRSAFPVPGGGIDARRVAEWTDRYGPDTIFLLGSSLYSADDPAAAAAELARELQRRAGG